MMQSIKEGADRNCFSHTTVPPVNYEESKFCLKWKFTFTSWQNLGITVNSKYNQFWSNLRFNKKTLLPNGSHNNKNLKFNCFTVIVTILIKTKTFRTACWVPLMLRNTEYSGTMTQHPFLQLCKSKKVWGLPPDVTSLRKQGGPDDLRGHPGVGACRTHFGGPVPFSR